MRSDPAFPYNAECEHVFSLGLKRLSSADGNNCRLNMDSKEVA